MLHKKLSWDDITKCVDSLEHKIKDDNIKFDWIVSINRGGLIPGVMLSHRLDTKHGVITIKNYDGVNKISHIKRDLYISMIGNFSGNLLIVDEIATSGETLQEAKKFIKKDSDIKIIKIATFHYQERSVIVPDYYSEKVSDEIWIRYPWEQYKD